MSSDEDINDSGELSVEEEPEAETQNEAEIIREQGENVAKQLIHGHSLKIVSKKNDLVPREHRKHWNLIRERASHLIKDTFGYDVMEIVADGDPVVFLVDSEVLATTDHIDDDCRKQQIFLFIILGYLTLKGPPVVEGHILEFLRKLGLHPGETAFGDCRELLTKELPAQYYLKKIKEKNSTTGEQTFRYDWGPRSIAEVDKEQLLNQFSTILGKPVRSFVQEQSPDSVLISTQSET